MVPETLVWRFKSNYQDQLTKSIHTFSGSDLPHVVRELVSKKRDWPLSTYWKSVGWTSKRIDQRAKKRGSCDVAIAVGTEIVMNSDANLLVANSGHTDHTKHWVKYCIAWMFGGGKPWQIWWITGGLPNITIQILMMSHDINKENKQTGIHRSFTHQKFWWEIRQSFPPSNIRAIRYLLSHMGFVKRRVNIKAKVTIKHFNELKKLFLLDFSNVVEMDDVLSQLVINW